MAVSFYRYEPTSTDQCIICDGFGDLSEWVVHRVPPEHTSSLHDLIETTCEVHHDCMQAYLVQERICPCCNVALDPSTLPSSLFPSLPDLTEDLALVSNTHPSRFLSSTFISNATFLTFLGALSGVKDGAVVRSYFKNSGAIVVSVMIGTAGLVAHAALLRFKLIRAPHAALMLGAVVAYCTTIFLTQAP